jgi:hypothetical protein
MYSFDVFKKSGIAPQANAIVYGISAGLLPASAASNFEEYRMTSEDVEGSIDLLIFDGTPEEAFKALAGYIDRQLRSDLSFSRMIYRYMLLSDTITGEQICNILIEQGCVEVPVAEKAAFDAGEEDACNFMVNRIANDYLTPAQLNLAPYSGSMVITDPWTGQVLALVSYPSFDNNRMSNGVDAV